MKRTQVTELFANIKNTFVSFFSIFMFVALGVGVFLGISWAGPALQNAADGMLGEGQFHNFQIQYPYGLTDDDIKELTAVEGVSQVEPERQSFQTLHRGNTNYTVKVQSLGEQLDVPIVREGVLPAKPGEMAFHAESAAKLGVSVGDTVTFEHDATDDDALTLETASDAASGESAAADAASASSDSASAASGESAAADVAAEAAKASGMKYLTSDTFKVTAIIDSVDYLAKSAETYGYSSSPAGTVEALVWVTDDAFSPSAFRDGYPVVNVRSESLDGIGTFSDAYAQGSSEIEDRISALGVGLAQARYDKLHGDAKSQLDAAQKKLDDGKAEIIEHVDAVGVKVDKLRVRMKRKSKYPEAMREACLSYWEAAQSNAEIRYAINTRITYASVLQYFAPQLAKHGITTAAQFRKVLHAAQSRDCTERRKSQI